MELKDILDLTRAGFTKDEILALTKSAEPTNSNVSVDTTPISTNSKQPEEVAKPEEVKSEPVVQPVPAQSVNQQIVLTSDQLQSLIQGLAVQTASGSIDMPKSINDTLSDRLQSLLKGE